MKKLTSRVDAHLVSKSSEEALLEEMYPEYTEAVGIYASDYWSAKYEEEKEELMKLSKEELVGRILGNKEDWGDLQQERRNAFEKGYHQAEKDLELTYDDICEIMEIRENVLEMDSYENLYEEILKRFKEKK